MASLIPPEPSTSTLVKPASSSLAATMLFVAKRLNPESEILAIYHCDLTFIAFHTSAPRRTNPLSPLPLLVQSVSCHCIGQH